jgi:hypothetical protein
MWMRGRARWCCKTPSRVARVVILNSWAWPLDDDPQMARAARFIGGAGRFLYKYANASLRLIMPSAYGDRRKLTQAIHRQYLEVFRDRESRRISSLAGSSWGPAPPSWRWRMPDTGRMKRNRNAVIEEIERFLN